MKQRTTVLVARQDDLSSVYEARKEKVTYTRNPVTIFTTEKHKFNEWINRTVKLIADQIARVQFIVFLFIDRRQFIADRFVPRPAAF